MPTNDERQEVARRLREVNKTEFYFTWCKVCMAVCGPDCPVGCDEDEMAVNVAHRLADFIKPEPDRTCHRVTIYSVNSGLSYKGCSVCHTPLDVLDIYCSRCGSKVVDE